MTGADFHDRQDFEDAGFRFRDEETFLSESYLLVFQRP